MTRGPVPDDPAPPAPRLAAWQRGVAGRLTGADPPLAPTSRRTPTDPAPTSTGTPAQRSGWKVTRALYAQWRHTRILRSAPLTLRVLGDRGAAVLDLHLASGGASTSYAAQEGAAFLDLVVRTLSDDPWVGTTARLERALLRARTPHPTGDRGGDLGPHLGDVRPHPAATLFPAGVDLRLLLAWLLGAGPRPPSAAPADILVAPGIPGLARPATAAESRLWRRLPAAADDLDPATVRDLVAAAVLTRSAG